MSIKPVSYRAAFASLVLALLAPLADARQDGQARLPQPPATPAPPKQSAEDKLREEAKKALGGLLKN